MQVRVGLDKIVGEVIQLREDTASIQCYEETGAFLMPISSANCTQPASLSAILSGVLETS